MPWARFDDNRHASGKLIVAGLEANGLDANAITWCSANLTDGFVPDAVLPVVAAGAVTTPADLAARLVAVDRWSRDDERGGWWVHDYLDYNPTRVEVVAKREKRREAGRKGGKASGEARRAAADEANGEPFASSRCEPRPVPSRPVVGNCDSDETLSSSRGVRGDDDDEQISTGEQATFTAALDLIARTALANRQSACPHDLIPVGRRTRDWIAADMRDRRPTFAVFAAAYLAEDPTITPDDLARMLAPEVFAEAERGGRHLRAVPDG